MKRNLIFSLVLLLFLSSSCNDDGNGQPTASISADPSSGQVPLVVRFDGSNSNDPDGDSLTFLWDFGDGGSASGEVTSHTFTVAGEYTVILTVSDGRGGEDDATVTIRVTSDTPTGNVYYVAVNGSDSNSGSSSSPWGTLQHAADSVTAGDTVEIKSGTYNAGFTMETSGANGSPITFRAESGSAEVIINAPSGQRDTIFLDNSDYIIIDGLKVQNAPRAAIRLSYSDHVTIKNCELANNSRWGVFTDFSDFTTIEDSQAYGSGEEHGIYISNSSDSAVMKRNRCYNNAGCGIQINADPSMGGDGISSNCVIDSNICYGNGNAGGAAINLASVRNSVISNNVLYNNYAGGIAAWDDGQGEGWGSNNLTIINNTIYFVSGEGRWCVSLKNGSSNAEIFNNILLGGSKGALEFDNSSLTDMKSNYNIFYSINSQSLAYNDDTDSGYTLAAWQQLGYDSLSFERAHAAILIGINSGNPHLIAGSDAIDSGTDVDLQTDFEGDTRPQGAGYDIGADERE